MLVQRNVPIGLLYEVPRAHWTFMIVVNCAGQINSMVNSLEGSAYSVGTT